MNSFTVLFDANVLYPNFLRDLLMRLAIVDLFRGRWSEDIHREWMQAVQRQRPDLDVQKIERTRRLMDANVLDSLVTGYEELIPALHLPDLDDRHVLAAAIRANAQLIVTRNHRDFPEQNLEPYDIKTQGPDDFLFNLLDLDKRLVLETLEKHRLALKRPSMTQLEYCQALERQELFLFASAIRQEWGLAQS
jgi:predicted nucleic acid-binding protein